MAINVNAANTQAGQLINNISQLRQARNNLVSYRASVSNNWQGKEVNYILTAIDQVLREIDSAIGNLDSLSTDIKNTAAQIRREEEAAAAAARARAEKNKRIRSAQNAYDSARKELDDLVKERDKLEKKWKKASGIEKFKLSFEINDLNEKIEKAEYKCDSAQRALKVAQR